MQESEDEVPVDPQAELVHAWPARLPQRWLVAHLVSILVVAAVMIVAARGQYFYYDEWDFLAQRAEWDILAPHVGHLSFFPQLLTTLTKGVFGLHSYWPFLLPTIAVHLIIVHLLWRVMMRAGAQPLLALLGAALFGVLAPSADNVMWAFQIGFITPFALGLGAALLAMRPTLPRSNLIWVTVLLCLGLGFSGTALSMAGAVIVLVFMRHGWRAALAPLVAVMIVYGTWYVIFNTGPSDWGALRADTPWEIFIGVPQYVAHGFMDSVAQFLPIDVLSAPLLVLLAWWTLVDLRRTGARGAGIAHYLVLALFAFAVLTAISRVGLGNESASAGRYTYVYGLLLAVSAVLALTTVARGSRTVIGAVSVLLVVLIGYNAAGFGVIAQQQAVVERTVPRAISAALTVADCSDESVAERTPAAVVAPTLTMTDVCGFIARGQFEPVEFTPDDLLDARINLFLRAVPVEAEVPAAIDCAQPDAGGVVPYNPETQVVSLPDRRFVRVHADENGAFTQYASVEIPAGVSRLVGIDEDLGLRLENMDGLCVFEP